MSRRVIAVATAAALAMPSFSNSLTAGPVVGSTDFGMFGISGLRGTGNGTITVTGVTGTVTRAILVWHGLATVATSISRGGTIGTTNFTGTNIGLSSDNCWSSASSQAFQADVTSAVTGNGSFALTNMRTSGTFDPNGASLLVYYNDGNSANNRDIAVFWGNDSNQTNTFDPAGWSATLSGINYSSGAANLNLIVSDGQNFSETGTNTLLVNATPITFPLFQGASLPLAPGSSNTNGGLWDHASASVAAVLVPGPNTLTVTGNPEGSLDCLSLISTVFDLPAGTVTVTPPVVAAAPTVVPTLSALGLGGLSLSAALWGIYGLRNRRRDELADDGKGADKQA